MFSLFDQVLPGLYVGNYRDSKDYQQLEKYNITHIVAIHDSPRRLLAVSVLPVAGSDSPIHRFFYDIYYLHLLLSLRINIIYA